MQPISMKQKGLNICHWGKYGENRDIVRGVRHQILRTLLSQVWREDPREEWKQSARKAETVASVVFRSIPHEGAHS